MSQITAPGIELFSEVYCPEKNWLQNCKTKPLAVCVAVISSIAKTLLFPLLSALSTLGFFGKGCFHVYKGEGEKAGAAFEASLISLAGALATGAFFVCAAYAIPIIYSSHIVLGAMTLTIAIHIYRVFQEEP